MSTLIYGTTDSGQIRSALTTTLEVHSSAANLRAPKIDAVVHFTAIPRIRLLPDNEAYRTDHERDVADRVNAEVGSANKKKHEGTP